MNQESLQELKLIIINELPIAIAKILKEESRNQTWVNIHKAAEQLDCSPKLLKSLIDKGALIPKLHYIDLTPDESRRTYRLNVKAITDKGLRSGIPHKKCV